MNDMAASAESTSLPPPVPAAAMWLPASALNCYVGDADMRSWLLTPGLLTQRIREAAGEGFAMHCLHEGLLDGEHVREIDMCCDGVVWMFAHTRIPALARQIPKGSPTWPQPPTTTTALSANIDSIVEKNES